MNNFRNYIKDIAYNGPVVAAASFLIISAALYFVYPENWVGRDLMSNLFAGGIDIVFTVLLLNWLLERREKIRTKPIRSAIYLDSIRILGEFCYNWESMVKAALAEPPPMGSDLLSTQYINVVKERLDIQAPAGYVDNRPWVQQIMNYSSDIKMRIDNVIQRYHGYIDPELVMIFKKIEAGPTLGIWERCEEAYRVNAAHKLYPINALPFVDSFDDIEVSTIKQLHQYLSNMRNEFEGDVLRESLYDITFAAAVKQMNVRDDIAPKIGSGRRNDKPGSYIIPSFPEAPASVSGTSTDMKI